MKKAEIFLIVFILLCGGGYFAYKNYFEPGRLMGNADGWQKLYKARDNTYGNSPNCSTISIWNPKENTTTNICFNEGNYYEKYTVEGNFIRNFEQYMIEDENDVWKYFYRSENNQYMDTNYNREDFPNNFGDIKELEFLNIEDEIDLEFYFDEYLDKEATGAQNKGGSATYNFYNWNSYYILEVDKERRYLYENEKRMVTLDIEITFSEYIEKIRFEVKYLEVDNYDNPVRTREIMRYSLLCEVSVNSSNTMLNTDFDNWEIG